MDALRRLYGSPAGADPALDVGMRVEGSVTVDLGTDWERPALIPVVSIPAGITDTVTLLGDHVFVRGRNATRLDVYALPTGRHLWRLGFPASVDTLRVDATAGVLLVQTFDASRAVATVIALELDTGRILWQQAGGLVSEQARDVDGAALLGPADPYAAGQVRLVDVRTGAVRWSRATAATTAFADAGPGRILQRSPAGDAQVVELSTGRVLASGLLGEPDPLIAEGLQPDPGAVPNMSIVDGLVFLLTPAEDASTLAAYDAGTFRERWRAIEDGRVYGVFACGPVLCVDGERGVAGVDPATGARRWRAADWSGAYPPARGSRVVVAAGSTGAWASALLDTATGVVDLAMHGWYPVDPAADPVLVTASEVGKLGVWVGVLDVVRARVSPVAWLPGIANMQCEQSAPDPGHSYLACPTRTGDIRVWRYRPV